ncbi:hypothetical protein OUS16_002074 [Enterococcus hirae]|nr:hypothetical protein [Enterococcus hirae]
MDLQSELQKINIKTPDLMLLEKQDEANELLTQIVENTSVLKELVAINRDTKLNTEELTYVMRAIYTVAKADNKADADAFFKKALVAINDSGEAVGNLSNLVSLLLGIYNTVKAMI